MAHFVEEVTECRRTVCVSKGDRADMSFLRMEK